MQQFYIDVNGDKIFCILENETYNGTWLICVHNLFQDKSEIWFFLSKIIKAIASPQLSICRYDARGCGDSTNQVKNTDLKMYFEDIDVVIKLIQKSYNPLSIILLGFGIGSFAVCETAKKNRVNAMILINPTFIEIFDYEKAFSKEILERAQKEGYVELDESIINKYWLDRLYYSGVEYENILGQSVNVELLKDLSALKLDTFIRKAMPLKCLVILSIEKGMCISLCKELAYNDYIQLEVVDADLSFSHPAVQNKIILHICEWIKQIE